VSLMAMGGWFLERGIVAANGGWEQAECYALLRFGTFSPKCYRIIA
jgi:hypothetical protein